MFGPLHWRFIPVNTASIGLVGPEKDKKLK